MQSICIFSLRLLAKLIQLSITMGVVKEGVQVVRPPQNSPVLAPEILLTKNNPENVKILYPSLKIQNVQSFFILETLDGT